jgi:Interferon-induced transmembrane protein
VWSVICTILFCWPVGAVGIICSVVARRRAVAGDIDGALRASHTAKKCCWASFIVVVVLAAFLLATGSHLPSLTS